MAIQPPNNEAFFREVDDELRRARIGSFWRNWGRTVAIALVLGLLVLAGVLYWQHRREQQAEQAGEAFAAIVADAVAGKQAGLQARLQPYLDSPIPGYRAGARLMAADLALLKNDDKAAAASFAAVENDAKLPKPYRDLALVRRTAAEFDKLDPRQVVQRLSPLAVPGSAWLGAAGEMVGTAYLRMNQPQRAGALFAVIARDKGVPASVRARAVQMAGSLGFDAVPDPAGEMQ